MVRKGRGEGVKVRGMRMKKEKKRIGKEYATKGRE